MKVRAGDHVTPGRTDPDNPGWRWVENADGLGGWLPEALVDNGVVVSDFDTMELTVSIGEQITPLESLLGWVRARAEDGRTGWLPGDCLD